MIISTNLYLGIRGEYNVLVIAISHAPVGHIFDQISKDPSCEVWLEWVQWFRSRHLRQIVTTRDDV